MFLVFYIIVVVNIKEIMGGVCVCVYLYSSYFTFMIAWPKVKVPLLNVIIILESYCKVRDDTC